MNSLLDVLRARGWKIEPSTDEASLLPTTVADRYPTLPADLLAFLSGLEVCHSKDRSAWFLTREDFGQADDSKYRWNEYELMAKQVYEEEGDRESLEQLGRFWNEHFPFMLAVHSDHDYLAVRRSDGSVVHGYAPFWEEPSVVAASFAAFTRGFESAALSHDPEWPYWIFLGNPTELQGGPPSDGAG